MYSRISMMWNRQMYKFVKFFSQVPLCSLGIRMFQALFLIAAGRMNFAETVQQIREQRTWSFGRTRAANACTVRIAVIVCHNRCGRNRSRSWHNHVATTLQNSESTRAFNAQPGSHVVFHECCRRNCDRCDHSKKKKNMVLKVHAQPAHVDWKLN